MYQIHLQKMIVVALPDFAQPVRIWFLRYNNPTNGGQALKTLCEADRSALQLRATII
jgi:hypothetical protein